MLQLLSLSYMRLLEMLIQATLLMDNTIGETTACGNKHVDIKTCVDVKHFRRQTNVDFKARFDVDMCSTSKFLFEVKAFLDV